ncbi:MAG: hypothetical protein H7A49_07500 [Akkermansiaceae bacterium]|nr:hypothetical protein [Akkermansiaceae bacterium]
MSWFEKNYEKVVLGGAVVAALGLAYFGWSKYQKAEEDFNIGLRGKGADNTDVPGAELIPKTGQSLKADRTWSKALDGDRPVDLFTGIPLFIKRDNPEQPLDLLKGEMVHSPIPNQWWLEHQIDLGFADSPQRDPDDDGFTNLEEFKGKTDPNNAKSHPELIRKLKYVKDESLVWVVRPGYGSNGQFPFNYEDGEGKRNRVSAANMIEPGGLFFPEAPQKNRFKLLGHEVRKVLNEKINIEQDVTIVRIEDQKPNKKGTIYEFPSPLPDDARKNQFLQYDRTAVLSLEALGMEGDEFKVEENTTFALPPDGAEKKYRVKTVTPDSITVEYPTADGGTKEIEINKGSLPEIPWE